MSITTLGSIATTTYVADGFTISTSHSLQSGSNRIVIAIIIAAKDPLPTVKSCDYNSAPMQLLWKREFNYRSLSAWAILEKDLPASTGSYTCSVDYNSRVRLGVLAVFTIQDASQRFPIDYAYTSDTSGTATTISQSIESPYTEGYVISCVSHFSTSGGTFTHGSGQNELVDLTADGKWTLAVSEETITKGGTDTQSHTASNAGDMKMQSMVFEPFGDRFNPVVDVQSFNKTDKSNDFVEYSVTHSLDLSEGSDFVLAVCVATNDDDGDVLTSATYDGVAMNQLTRYTFTYNSIRWFYLLETDLPTTGNYTFSASFGGNGVADATITIATLKNIKQQAPEAEVGDTGGALSDVITTLTDNAVVLSDFHVFKQEGAYEGVIPDTGQALLNYQSGGGDFLTLEIKPTAGSLTQEVEAYTTYGQDMIACVAWESVSADPPTVTTQSVMLGANF